MNKKQSVVPQVEDIQFNITPKTKLMIRLLKVYQQFRNEVSDIVSQLDESEDVTDAIYLKVFAPHLGELETEMQCLISEEIFNNIVERGQEIGKIEI